MTKRFSIDTVDKGHFKVRLLVINIGLLLLLASFFTALSIQQQTQALTDNLKQKGVLLADLLSHNAKLGIFSENRSTLETSLSGIIEQEDVVSATVFSNTGKLLASMGEDHRGEYQISKDALLSVKQTGSAVTIDEERRFVFWKAVRPAALKLPDSPLNEEMQINRSKSGNIGVVRVELDKSHLMENIDALLLRSGGISLAFLSIAVLLVVSIIRQIVGPLERLTNSVISYGEGEEIDVLKIETDDEIGQLTHAFNSMTDALRKREQEKEDLENQLRHRQKMDAIGTLAGGIAHDFNNILSSVLFKLALIKKDLMSGKDMTPRIVELEKVFNRAKGLTQQLLTFSKGGAPVRQAASVGDIVKDTVSFTLCGSNVKCKVASEKDLKPAKVDENQISQVINNLIINADQAMPQGGIVWLKTKNTVVPEGSPLEIPAGEYVQLDVSDSGVGIEPENLKKVFDPYFTTKQRGVGLGLALTYSIIQKHEGYVIINSKVGEGTTFSIYLPATEEEIQEKRETWDMPQHGHGKVLIMDDEDIFRRDATELLETVGYTVTEAADGKEALARYKEEKQRGTPFDIVIMDLTIPGGMGGEETIEKLLKYDPKAKAIVSSGYTNSPIMSNFKKHGFLGVVVKPFKVHELTQLINEIINKE